MKKVGEHKQSFSCYLIGETHLLIECAKILLNAGNRICGVISSDNLVIEWAKENNISCFVLSKDSILGILSQDCYDYLFSIVNGHILSKEILKTASKLAISYHDSPLPMYAGINAASWAIINREKMHGITWYVMNERIYSGKILRQNIFELTDKDIAFTLSSRCFEIAIDLFSELVFDLMTGQSSKYEQAKNRSYCPRFKKPKRGAILNFEDNADDIEALFRGLNFDIYDNPISMPKLWINQKLVFITKLRVGRLCELPCGTSIECCDDYLEIAANTKSLVIEEIVDHRGKKVTFPSLFKDENCSRHVITDMLLSDLVKIEQIESSIAKYESFWYGRLVTLNLIGASVFNTPCFQPLVQQGYGEAELLRQDFLGYLSSNTGGVGTHVHTMVLSCIALFLSALNDVRSFDVGYVPEFRKDFENNTHHFFAEVVPLRINITMLNNINSSLQEIVGQIDITEQHETYANDLLLRYRLLRKKLRQDEFSFYFPVVIKTVDNIQCCDSLIGDLEFIFERSTQKIILRCDLNIISESDLIRIRNFLSIFIDQIVTQNKKTVLNLTLLSYEGEKQVLENWNQTICEYPSSKSLHLLFQEQVNQSPDSIALLYEKEVLTYRELDKQSNQLARYIQKRYKEIKGADLVADSLLGICLERSINMVVSMLAILKAGVAYVPLDPSYPKERIHYILTDTKMRLVLTQSSLFDILDMTPSYCDLIAVDEVNIWQSYDSSDLDVITKSEDLCYVIYTSGTTGKPKGVMIENNSAVNYISWMISTGAFCGEACMDCSSSIAFDATVQVLWLPLSVGMCVSICPLPVKRDPAAYLTYLEERAIAIIKATPSYLNSLLDCLDSVKVDLNALSVLIVGGEASSKNDMIRWQKHYPHCRIMHHYGPTETTVGSLFHWFDIDKRHYDSGVPLGYPQFNTQCYILNTEGCPVPIGVAGELHIGGAGLARGYLNQPELTQEKFIISPFQTAEERQLDKNNRLYKTGDLVRWLPDGNIEYIGRNDFQVKLRGFRVELGEIESVLSHFPGVKKSVILLKDQEGNKYLIGYYVADVLLDEVSLKKYLEASLPDYMVPSIFVHLNHFPLTVNGKLDRQALPDPDFRDDETTYVAPGNELEEVLCQIWQEVFGLERVGIRDDFFRLGGNSILAIRVIHKMSRALGQRLSIASIFEHKCIADLLKHALKHDEIHIVVSDDLKPALSFAQERLWFIEQYEGGTDVYHVPMVWSLHADTNIASFKKALNAVVQRHDILRTTFSQSETGEYYQQISHGDLAIQEIDIDAASVNKAIQSVLHESFRLEQEWPIRAWLYRVQGRTDDQVIVVINVHHIAFDGWSSDVLQRELEIFYRHYEEGQPISLLKLLIQYKDYAVWQRSYLSGDELSRQLSYWKNRLEGAEPVNLPLDRVRPSRVDYRGNTVRIGLSRDLSDQLRQLAQNQGVTLYTVLLSGFMVLLSKYSGQEDIVVGTPIANRHYTELSDLIGFFVNSLAIRNTVSGGATVESLIQSIHTGMVQAQSHQDLPFEKLVDGLGVERDLSRHPIFQIMFGVQHFGQVKQEDGIAGLYKSYLIGNAYQVAKFDLSLFINDGGRELQCNFNYAQSLFDQSSIERLSQHYERLLEVLVADSKQAVKDVQILSMKEYHQLVYQWNETDKPYPKDKTLQQI